VTPSVAASDLESCDAIGLLNCASGGFPFSIVPPAPIGRPLKAKGFPLCPRFFPFPRPTKRHISPFLLFFFEEVFPVEGRFLFFFFTLVSPGPSDQISALAWSTRRYADLLRPNFIPSSSNLIQSLQDAPSFFSWCHLQVRGR